MTKTPIHTLSPTQRRRLIAWGLLRAITATTVLIAVYFLGPLDRTEGVPLVVSLSVALLVLLGVSVWQLRTIIRSAQPAVRAVEALAMTVPLFLLLFAASYFLLAQADAANFSPRGLTRADALYFTVTIFATVGFGDITATTETARMLVSVQMILDLLFLGLGVRVVVGAVRLGRQHQAPAPGATTADDS